MVFYVAGKSIEINLTYAAEEWLSNSTEHLSQVRVVSKVQWQIANIET